MRYHAAATAAFIAISASVHGQVPPGERVTALTDVVKCRAVADASARLACYDRSVAVLDKAETDHTVLVVDQREVKKARRDMFGMKLPQSPLFAGSADIDHIETTLEEGVAQRDGSFAFRLADGSRWVQTDDAVVAGKPRRGEMAVVRKGMFGNFKLSLGNQPAVRVRREE